MAMYTSDGVKIAETSGSDIVLPDPEKINELRRIADAATESANLAKEQAKSAKKSALFSKVVSIISLIISLASIFIPFISSAAK